MCRCWELRECRQDPDILAVNVGQTLTDPVPAPDRASKAHGSAFGKKPRPSAWHNSASKSAQVHLMQTAGATSCKVVVIFRHEIWFTLSFDDGWSVDAVATQDCDHGSLDALVAWTHRSDMDAQAARALGIGLFEATRTWLET